MSAEERIADALEEIARDGIIVHVVLPDEVDKFVTDLPAMKISDELSRIANAINHIGED